MSWLRIALAFVFFSNAAFLLLTGVLAWRVWLNTRRGREELARSARHVATEMARLAQTADKAEQTFDQMRADMALWLEECRARPAPPPLTASLAAPLPAALAGGFDASKDRELEAILAGVEAEKMRLNRKLDHLQDSLKRTLVEKEFIEDRFLVLDQARHAAAAPPVAVAVDVSPTLTPAD